MVYFFYGTLCDADVRQLILGYRPSRRQLRPATLPGFRRKIAAGKSYPVLIRAPGGLVHGVLFRPGKPQDQARLDAYEGPDYLSRCLRIKTSGVGKGHRARVYLPVPGRLPAGREDWRLDRWRREAKSSFLSMLHAQGF